ncbi:MAG: hypothetical protein EZS28_030096, partial [Streblomastix strix]
DLNDLGTQFHNAFNYKWSKVKLYIHPPIPVLNKVLQKMKQDKAQGIVIAPIWPGQSWNTKLKNLSIKFLFLGQADKILEMGQRMKDNDQKFLQAMQAPSFWTCRRCWDRLDNEMHEDERIFRRWSQLAIQGTKIQYSQERLLLPSIITGLV